MRKLILLTLCIISLTSYAQTSLNTYSLPSSTSSANVYTYNPTPALKLENGASIRLKFVHGNTTASTLNISGTGDIALTQSDGTALSSNDIKDNSWHWVIYDGSANKWKLDINGSGGGGGGSWGSITGTLSAQTDLQTALNLKANLASPSLTGTPTVPTAAPGTSNLQIANTAFVANAITGASVSDGDKGDITVSGSGTTWTIDNLAVTNAKINDVAYSKVTGAPSALPPNGSAGGDLSSTYPNPTVSKILGNTIPANASGVLTNNGSGTLSWVAAGGGGTVTSVGVTTANGISATPTPITTSGNFTFSLGAITPTSVNGTTATEIGYVSGVTSALQTQLNGKTPSSRLINTTAPLTGGGDLSADRTLAIGDAAADGATKGASTYAAADFNSSSGVIALDYANSNIANKFLAINTQTSSYTAVLTDKDTKLVVMNSAIATNFTVPPNSSVAFPVGTILSVMPIGGGSVTIVQGAGVTVNPPTGGSLINTQQGSPFYIWQSATDVWYAWNGAPIIGSGLSVFGVTGSSSASYASIVGGADQVLRVNSAASALAFGSLDLSKSGTVGSSILPIANGGTGGTVGSWLISGTTTPTGNMTIARGSNTLTFTGSYSGTTPGLTETISEVATANAQQVIGRDYNDTYSNGGFTTTTYVGARWRAGRYGFNTGTNTVEGIVHANGEGTSGTTFNLVLKNSAGNYVLRSGDDGLLRINNNGTSPTISAGTYATGAAAISGAAMRFSATGGFIFSVGSGTGEGFKVNGTTASLTGPVNISTISSDAIYTVGSGTATVPLLSDSRTSAGAGTTVFQGFIESDATRSSGFGTASPVNTVEVNGSLSLKLRTITASTTAAATDYTILCDATTGNIVVTLPTASTVGNRIYVIKKTDATANTVSFTADGGTITLNTQYSGKVIQSNLTTYSVIGSF